MSLIPREGDASYVQTWINIDGHCHQNGQDCLVALVKRAIEGVRKYKPKKGPSRNRTPLPLWARVKDIFHHGSGYSSELCRRFGFDPNETWVGEDDA